MKNAWIRKVLRTRASRNAMAIRTGSSARKLRRSRSTGFAWSLSSSPSGTAPDDQLSGVEVLLTLLRARGRAQFLDLGLLAHPVAQVVQLRAPHLAAAHDLDVVDHRRVHGEG